MTLLDDAAQALSPELWDKIEQNITDDDWGGATSLNARHKLYASARAVLEVVAKWMDDEAKALTQRIPNKFGNYAKDNLISRADQLQRCAVILRKENG